MASTSHASQKGETDADIFKVLEDITDSDVTIVSSEEDEDSNEPDSDKDR
jgi:aspartate carbamoyltransferase catalytic subunit